ncbi:unnamed protein product [Brassica rapa subsp. narinosa]
MEVLCICGQWISKESLQWEFLVDLKRNASIISIEEDLLYEDLMKIVSEDFSVKEEEISLSYGFSLDMKCIIESFPPLSIGNTRQLRTFISKTRAFDGTCRLCVKVSTDPASCNTQASDTVASTVPLNANPVILSTVQSEKQVHFPLNALPDFSPVHIGLSPNTRVAGDIKVNSYFKTKRELMLRMKKWALEWKFEYKTVSSNKSRVLLSCVDENCTWRMRAIKLHVSDFFVIKKYVHEHTCDTTHRKANHRQASAKLLGSLISSNYGEKKEGLKPKQIIEQVRMLHGVHINYKQSWRVREEAQILVRGTPEDSYYNLSRWLYKITETNPGSLTYQHVDAAGKFKYAFVAFGPSIRGFSLMRRVIAVDVVDAENGASWKWFFRGLSQKIPDTSDLVFKLVSRLGAAMLLNVYQVDRSEFEVKNETMKFVVDLEKRHCTCNVFDIDKIPCIHAIAAAKHIKRDENRFVDASHLTETWAKAYAESIHPGGELSTSTYPENIDELSCPPPATKKKSGRPPTKRKRSVGEFGVPGSKSQSHKCSRCGTGGHNKITCQRPIG